MLLPALGHDSLHKTSSFLQHDLLCYQLVVAEASGERLFLVQYLARPGLAPGFVWVPVPRWLLVAALAMQLPYKPWNVPALPV